MLTRLKIGSGDAGGSDATGLAPGVPHPVPGRTIDPNIDNGEMEWVVKPNGLSPHGNLFVGDDQVVCYGIMLREVAQKPRFPN